MQSLTTYLISALMLVVLSVSADIRCYSCSSYMSQCRSEVTRHPSEVHRGVCSSKCFIRQGEDAATYRGCFDEFSRVAELTNNYIGCRNQTWNNRNLLWCFCDTDMCNGATIETIIAAATRTTTPSTTTTTATTTTTTMTPTTLPVARLTSLTAARMQSRDKTMQSREKPLLASSRETFKYIEEEEIYNQIVSNDNKDIETSVNDRTKTDKTDGISYRKNRNPHPQRNQQHRRRGELKIMTSDASPEVFEERYNEPKSSKTEPSPEPEGRGKVETRQSRGALREVGQRRSEEDPKQEQTDAYVQIRGSSNNNRGLFRTDRPLNRDTVTLAYKQKQQHQHREQNQEQNQEQMDEVTGSEYLKKTKSVNLQRSFKTINNNRVGMSDNGQPEVTSDEKGRSFSTDRIKDTTTYLSYEPRLFAISESEEIEEEDDDEEDEEEEKNEVEFRDKHTVRGVAREDLKSGGGFMHEDELLLPPEDKYSLRLPQSYVSSDLAAQIQCVGSGYYGHPTDCTQYIACVYDPYARIAVLHIMRCPELLFWENDRKICVEHSVNCGGTAWGSAKGGTNVSEISLGLIHEKSSSIEEP